MENPAPSNISKPSLEVSLVPESPQVNILGFLSFNFVCLPLFFPFRLENSIAMGRLHQDDPPASSSHSLHTLDEAPPPYSDDPEPGESVHHGQLFQPAHPVQAVKPPASIRPLRIIDSAYVLPGGTDIKPHDKVALTLTPLLSTDPEGLYEAIRRQIKLPPRPLLSIHGSHTETSHGSDKDKKSNSVTDFHFRLDLAETMLTGWEGGHQDINWMEVEINTDEDLKKAYRGGILRSHAYKAPKSRGVSLDESSDALISHDADDEQDNGRSGPQALRLWCERFCRDPAPVKSYVLLSSASRKHCC
jgi:hypothetical protein